MNIKMNFKILAPLFLLLASQSAFAQVKSVDAATSSTNALPGRTVMIFAAASATNAIKDINDLYKKASGVDVQTNFGASSTLAQQIESGAKADLFLSANKQWGDDVAKKGLMGETKDLLGNRLVAIVPIDSKLQIKTPEDLATSSVRVLALADPAAVPAGIYGKQAMTKLGLWEKIAKKATGSADVRQALAIVERGEAEAGIVYATDAAISKKVRIAFEFDPKLNDPIVYPLILLKSSSGGDAKAYYDYLSGPEAAAIFKRFGFSLTSDKATTMTSGANAPK